MERDYLRIPGIVSIVIGLFFLLGSSTGITGFVIGGETKQTFGYYIGIVFASIGILVYLIGRRIHNRDKHARANFSLSRKDTENAARLDYFDRFGRNPTRTELEEYAHNLQSSGEIFDIITDQRKRRKIT